MHQTEHGSLLVVALLHGPLTREQIIDRFLRVGRHFGVPMPKAGTDARAGLLNEVEHDLDRLKSMGILEVDEQGAYLLTDRGRKEAEETDRNLERVGSKIRSVMSDATLVSKISVGVNVLLTILKLGVGVLFNSVALLADGFDNLIDVVSAIAVFLGIKHRRELYSTGFIIVVMFGTSLWIAYESISRIIRPEIVATGWLIIAAAVFSGIVCYVMSVYQHVVGKRMGSLSLVSQSIDSRNHVIYAAAVLVGIIFAGFGIFIVDSLVALAVAALISKSAYDLTTETVRIARGEEMDFSAFGREYEKVIDGRRKSYFKSWLLFTLKEARTRAEIVSSFDESFAADGLPVVTHFGLSLWQGFDLEERLDPLLKDLTDEGLISERDGGYHLTGKGSRERSRRLWYDRFT